MIANLLLISSLGGTICNDGTMSILDNSLACSFNHGIKEKVTSSLYNPIFEWDYSSTTVDGLNSYSYSKANSSRIGFTCLDIPNSDTDIWLFSVVSREPLKNIYIHSGHEIYLLENPSISHKENGLYIAAWRQNLFEQDRSYTATLHVLLATAESITVETIYHQDSINLVGSYELLKDLEKKCFN